MNKEPNEALMMQIASQLSRPEGAEGIITAGRMAHTNNNMTNAAIKALNILDKDIVLEIGPGNGTHVQHLMNNADHIRYYGADISATMVTEANRINKTLVKTGDVSFTLSQADKLNFDTGFFDKVFTVNTLYFWEEPLAFAMEIRRVLKPGGLFCLAIATEEFMKGLPFTKYKFKLYDAPAVEKLLRAADFVIADISLQKDLTTSHTGDAVDRDIIIVTAKIEI
jgi:ubiquinone/menaquinone biosynthesis C-methylase UbiE